MSLGLYELLKKSKVEKGTLVQANDFKRKGKYFLSVKVGEEKREIGPIPIKKYNPDGSLWFDLFDKRYDEYNLFFGRDSVKKFRKEIEEAKKEDPGEKLITLDELMERLRYKQ